MTPATLALLDKLDPGHRDRPVQPRPVPSTTRVTTLTGDWRTLTHHWEKK
jgi:hypothetical protein